MRVVAGKYRGRRIEAPEGLGTRPSTDRLREALFNILEHREGGLKDTRVLDLFAGSGALGIEALSRGAAFCLFVDMATDARAAIRTNIEVLSLMGQTKLFRRDAKKMGPIPASLGGPFDIVFIDPPYADPDIENTVISILADGWVNKGGLIVVERGSPTVPLTDDRLSLEDQRRYGDSHLFFFKLGCE